MSGNFKKEDLRVIKTQKAFQNAIESLLNRRKFKQITINDLCEEALTSRAAFYTHYKDKYDLLQYWFSGLLIEKDNSGIEIIIDQLIYGNSKIMRNIILNADNETLEIFRNFLHLLLDVHVDLPDYKKVNPEYIIVSNFYVGGIFEIILWQIKHGYPRELESTKKYLLTLLKKFHVLIEKM